MKTRCRFWAEGKCKKGNSCDFDHSGPGGANAQYNNKSYNHNGYNQSQSNSSVYGGTYGSNVFGGSNPSTNVFSGGGSSNVFSSGGSSNVFSGGGSSNVFSSGGSSNIFSAGGSSNVFSAGGSSNVFSGGGSPNVFSGRPSNVFTPTTSIVTGRGPSSVFSGGGSPNLFSGGSSNVFSNPGSQPSSLVGGPNPSNVFSGSQIPPRTSGPAVEGISYDVIKTELQDQTIWPLTCYAHTREAENIIQGDLSFEEIRHHAYNTNKNEHIQWNQKKVDEMIGRKNNLIINLSKRLQSEKSGHHVGYQPININQFSQRASPFNGSSTSQQEKAVVIANPHNPQSKVKDQEEFRSGSFSFGNIPELAPSEQFLNM